MRNLTTVRLEELVEYLADREEFLCRPTHNYVYLKSWSDLFDYNENFHDILIHQFNIQCDCQALVIGKKKLLKSKTSTENTNNISTSTFSD